NHLNEQANLIMQTGTQNKQPTTRALLDLDSSVISLRTATQILSLHHRGLLADCKITDTIQAFEDLQQAKQETEETYDLYEQKKRNAEDALDLSLASISDTSADAPADESSDVKPEILPTAGSAQLSKKSAIVNQTTSLSLKNADLMIDYQMAQMRIKAEYQRRAAALAKELGSTATSIESYLTQAVENSALYLLSIISQLVGMEKFLSLTSAAKSHGYDSCASSFDQLKSLLDSMQLNSIRVDVAYVYNIHHGGQSSYSNCLLEDALERRREERIKQNRYPLSPFGYQLMELIKILDTSIFPQIIVKYSSMKQDQVTESTILDAEDEIRKAISGLKDVRVPYDLPTRSRHAPSARRAPVPTAAVHQPAPAGEPNLGQSSGQSNRSKHGSQLDTGRYAPRDRSQQHRTQPPHRSQQRQHRPQPPHHSQQQPSESPRSTYVRFEDTETSGDRGSRAGDGGGHSGASGERGGRSARPFNYTARASSRHHSSGLY
ncbi:MAG TPA: hypothetical protein VIG24_15830, partial [Acidimicrobiia bacterium]